jgi:hypothetical protein
MKIYVYIADGGDGSYSLRYYRTWEDRERVAKYHEKLFGYIVDGACDYTIDTDNIKFSEPPELVEDDYDED